MPSTSNLARLGWKIYFFTLAAFVVLMYVVVLSLSFRPLHFVDLIITLAGLLGLYAFAFQKRIGSRNFWRAQSVIFPVWDLLFNFVLSPGAAGLANRAVIVALLVFFIPQYWALWQYGYESAAIWNPARV